MAVTSSYNRRTGVRYAYVTTYEFDESRGRKVQRRRCVGHFDPETGEVVPNGPRGRRRVEAAPAPAEAPGPANAPKRTAPAPGEDALEALSRALAALRQAEAAVEACVAAMGGEPR